MVLLHNMVDSTTAASQNGDCTNKYMNQQMLHMILFRSSFMIKDQNSKEPNQKKKNSQLRNSLGTQYDASAYDAGIAGSMVMYIEESRAASKSSH